jgi:C4-dicarboxylate-specific signal transduction histidine kinase
MISTDVDHSLREASEPFASWPQCVRSASRRVNRLLALVLLCALAWPCAAWAAEVHRVLVLYSNGRLLPANVEGDRAIAERLAQRTDLRIELSSEFLDSPRFSGEAYERAVADYLRTKYAAEPPQVLVAAAEEALAFWMRHRDELFPGVPVVHLSIARARLEGMQPLPPDVVGIPVEYDVAGTLEQALRWHPWARRLVFVGDSSAWGQAWERRMRSQAARFADRLTVEVLGDLPLDELERRLHALPDDAIVFTAGLFADGTGRPITPRESALRIAAASPAPVYTAFSTHVGTGVVGGRMTAFDVIGRRGAEIVLELLDGAAPASLSLPAVMPATWTVDWRQLKRWGIDPRTLPADAVVQFREPTFWEAYGHWVAVASAVMLLQAGLIAALLLERGRRRRAGAALARNEQHMSLAARAARLTLWTLDDAAKAARVLPAPPGDGATSDALADFATLLERVDPADRDAVERAIAEARSTGGEFEVEYRVPAADGTTRWQVARGRADPAAGHRLLGIVADITARKQAELEVAQSQAALQHMTRVSQLGQLSASIAHQLNQPLASILANAQAAQTMLRREPLDVAELREIVDDIVAADRGAADVIRRLGALFRRGEPSLAPLDLNDVVRDTLEIVRTSLQTRHIAVHMALAPELPALDGDRVQLQQMLLNLVTNAADAMASLPEADRRLTIETTAEAGMIRVCVADLGPGVTAEAKTKLFEPFWSTKTDGMGIGLAVCRSIATAHGGTLDVTNAPDGGAVFCVRLPALKTP